MPAKARKIRHPLGQLLVTTALVATTTGYGWWQQKLAPPPALAAPAPAPMEANITPGQYNLGGYEFHEGPAASAITMPPGTHLEDGEYTSGPWDTGYGMVQVKVQIRHGAFTAADFLQLPFERSRSDEISHFAKPLLLHEMIHEQKTKVNIITTATYTSFGFQDALAEVIDLATRK